MSQWHQLGLSTSGGLSTPVLRLAKVCMGLAGLTAFYFGPWLPSSLSEATGWFRHRWSSGKRNPIRIEEPSGLLLIVVPCHSSERVETVSRTVGTLRSNARDVSKVKVILVVSGSGEEEETSNMLLKMDVSGFAEGSAVIAGPAGGRGPTQNAGFAKDRLQSDIVIFCHADTLLPKNYDREVRSALADEEVLMTAFSFGLDREDHSTLRFVVNSANKRSRWFWYPYGDQAIAFRSRVFKEMGGFREDYKMMEDFDLVRRIRSRALRSRRERIEILSSKVCSSAR